MTLNMYHMVISINQSWV